jgi:hypothetical protein
MFYFVNRNGNNFNCIRSDQLTGEAQRPEKDELLNIGFEQSFLSR